MEEKPPKLDIIWYKTETGIKILEYVKKNEKLNNFGWF